MKLFRPSRRLAGLAAASLFALTLPIRAVAAPPTVDIRGDWAGQAEGGGPYIEHFLTENCATGAIKGTGGGGGVIWPVTGTLDGRSLTLEDGPYNNLPSYKAFVSVEVSADGNSMNGTFTDTFGNDGNVALTRISGPPNDGAGCTPVATPTARPTPPSLDHFVSYGVKGSKNTGAAFAPLGPVHLQVRNFDVVKVATLLLPADKNGEGRHDTATHLTEYALKLAKSEPKAEKLADVHVLNQCSDVFVTLGKPVSLMVPTAKDLANPATAPLDADHQRDHFLCFQAKAQKKLANGTAVAKQPKGTQVSAVDQFQSRRYDVGKISKLCLPTDKSGTPIFLKGPSQGQPATITPATVRHPTENLLCYKVKAAKSTIAQPLCGAATPKDKGTPIVPKPAKHTPKIGMFTANQLGQLRLDSTKEVEFCVPSFATFPND